MRSASSHARLAPSSAHRWAACTASVGFIEANWERLPVQDTRFADEGTAAHEVAARLLRAYEAAGRKHQTTSYWVAEAPPDSIVVTEEMQIYVGAYYRFVTDMLKPGDRLLVEQKVPLFYSPDENGTVDAAIIGKNYIRISDLKYGAGVSVEARDNPQLAIYAESLIRQLEVVDDFPDEFLVQMAIYQPRDRNNPEPVRLWVVSRAELREFCMGILEAAVIIDGSKGTPTFVPDPDHQCRFCPAKGLCDAYAKYSLAVVPGEFDNLDRIVELPSPGALTREQRVRVIQMKKGLIAWLEAVEDQEVADLMGNAAPAGFKLVEGKSNRRWTDPEAAAKLLKNYLSADEVRPPGDVISPAAAEAALKAHETSTKFENRMAALITKPEGKPTLVPEDDKRTALSFDPTHSFGDLDVI